MALPFDRLFSMEAFEGLRTLRNMLATAPGTPPDELVAIIINVEADAASLDLEAAVELHGLVSEDTPADGYPFYRSCIKTLLVQGDHSWGRQITLGRGFFTRKLDRDKVSIFVQAGLMLDPPDDEVVLWWDETTAEVRFEADILRNARARQAERLTMDFEIEKLVKAGCEEKPRWMSIEDNTVGYDVQSYTVTQYGLNRLAIEVKSSLANPLEFQVTKGEWRVATTMGEAYIFHIWDMRQEPPTLHVRTVEQVAPHVPHDQQDGEWKVARIPVGGD